MRLQIQRDENTECHTENEAEQGKVQIAKVARQREQQEPDDQRLRPPRRLSVEVEDGESGYRNPGALARVPQQNSGWLPGTPMARARPSGDGRSVARPRQPSGTTPAPDSTENAPGRAGALGCRDGTGAIDAESCACDRRGPARTCGPAPVSWPGSTRHRRRAAILAGVRSRKRRASAAQLLLPSTPRKGGCAECR